MNIIFNISYNTQFGEELVLNLLDGNGRTTPYRMRTNDGKTWTCNMSSDLPPGAHVDYYYSVVRGEDNIVHKEWAVKPHRLELNMINGKSFTVYDKWNDMPEDSYLYSSAFTDCIRRRRLSDIPLCSFGVTLRLKVRAPQLRGHERLVVVGSVTHVGAWDARKGISMYEHNHNEWVVDIDMKKLGVKSFEFKFVAVSAAVNDDVIWEDRLNREITVGNIKEGETLVSDQGVALFPICNERFAGTLVPVFSLRSASGFGVGDFGDLRKMIDWATMTKQRVLQVLPINDTTNNHTWTDSYPYNCVSIFALHPQYVDLRSLPPIDDMEKRAEFEALRQELNALGQIDYVRVNAAKDAYMRILFAQEGKTVMSTADFKAFFEESESWLVPYAQYCFLRDKNGTADFTQWPDHNLFNEDDRRALASTRTAAYKDVAYYYFVQFVLYSQMSAVHDHARQKGVILKGDIPIGVCRDSCDVWQEPRYFNMDGQAGAPPDDFSRNGQNWGFPTYNWEEMMKDGCQWWIRRFKNMAHYFDAYRIDHVLGFFRIWEIPVNSVHGLLGQFAPALGMTREEIEAYGLKFDERLYTEPYITDRMLAEMFGSEAETVRQTYLEPTTEGRYRMKEEYDTQRKVQAAFSGKDTAEDAALREKLYTLISDVLFVRDHRTPGKYHPRITVQYDYIYKDLNDADKYAFNRLYNDFYYRRNNHYWYREAMTKLPKLVEATRMLVCAEDLGMVPDCVAWVMNELRILSLELQSMPKEYGVRFGNIGAYPYRSVCTISSHDMPTLRQWWDEDRERTLCYYHSVLGKYGDAPHPLPGWLARDIIARHMACPSMLCILAIQDWLAVDEHLRRPDADAERINIPSNPRHYWRYRMHVNIEDMAADLNFNQNITDLIREGGRM